MTSRERILEIVRRCLEIGQAVEIDGLGTFRAAPAGGYTFEPESRPLVFIAYVEEDLALARRLCDDLAAAGCAPWLDKDQLLAGQNWPRAIERAIDISDVFLPCFSPRSLAKRGQFQCELQYALDCARRRPLEDVFLMPVRFQACVVPRRIAEQVQYVDLFPDWKRGVERVVQAIGHAAKRRARPELCA
jgi:hypothetical protein